MSEENVEAVRAIYRAFAEHRFPSKQLDMDFAWETHPAQPGASTHRGQDAVRAYFRDWVGGWDDAKSDVERLLEHDDQVIAFVHGRYRISDRGVPIEQHYGHIWTLRDGKAIHARAVTHSEALRAAGLEQ